MEYEKPKISYKAIKANTSLDVFLDKKKDKDTEE
jgi:hypothetical protein|tara:strand:+ start:145 stop:246 length:102 start_codon:yes stop_codon:yes gene_type:complete